MGTSLHRLDERGTGYRFDVDHDVPWSRLGEPGLFFTDAMLARLGFDPTAIARSAGARASLDVVLALVTAKTFAHLELDVIRFVAAEGARRPSRSATWLLEEEEKHVALFNRLLAGLEERWPVEARALRQVYRPPPSFENLRARTAHYGSPDELAWTFWLNTVFFEEYTVFFQHALEEVAAESVQPAWLAAHHCHRQEELQHVLTDAAYLEELDLDDDTRRRLSKSFVFFLEESFADFFGVRAASQALAALHPSVAGLPKPGARFRELPLFQDVLRHRAFRQTRRAAPYLGDLRLLAPASAAIDGGPPALSPSPGDTLVGRLERVAHSGRGGLAFVHHDGTEQHLSHAALWAEAETRLGLLQARGARPGDFAVLLTAQPRDTVPWFWACLLGGLVPAPVALPTTAADAEELQRLLRIHAQLDDPWVIADDAVAPAVRALLSSSGGGEESRVLSAGESGAGATGGRAALHRGRSSDTAFLQFSSGSLGDPRGVVLTHENLLSDISAMLAFRQHRADEVFVSWMPLFHDMGLIGYHLTPVVAATQQVLLSPLSFMREPLSWLRALTKHRGSITGAPNFALARLLPHLTPDAVASLDLSSMHTFLVGAEPIAKHVLDAFGRVLAPAGLRQEALCPAYGLAEATLAVTMLPPGETPRGIRVSRHSLDSATGVVDCTSDEGGIDLVDLGKPLPGVELRIADEHGAVLPEGVVGTVEVCGPTVSPGYHREPPQHGWLDTGDLGLVREGRLFVTGRKKDVFFVGGRNHYAHDVEAVARELPLLHPGAIALVVDWNDRWGVDDLVLFVALRDERDADAALAAVHAHVHRRLGLALGRVVQIDKRAVPRTTSGKLKRRALLEQMRAGAFATARAFALPRTAASTAEHALAGPDDAAAVDVVRHIWASVLEISIDGVDADDEFRALGGDSFKAVQVHDRLEKHFVRTLSPDVLVVGTTPRRMAAYLLEVAAPGGAAPATQAPGARAREAAQASTKHHDIAVVSLAVRAPQVQTPDELWRLLMEGRTTIGRAPSARLEEARLLGEDTLARGSWLETVDQFDAPLFSLSDAEARAMGPAQRLFLEVAFEALAGAAQEGKRVGVFVGAGNDGYAHRYRDHPQLVSGHSLLGALPNMVAARVARTFGLVGPALTVDTACSSSLTAVHLACESLRAGACDVAIAGGVQVGLSGDLLLSFQRAGLLSSNGRCRPFDEHAAGLVPGEAAGAVVLKPLARALEGGDHILAVIRGTAMNNDGGALSGTAPSPAGQSEVIARAWRDAGLDPASARFIEAHAAGTAIGDAVEVRALQAVIAAREPIPIGSIKGNLAHTLAAAGVMSLIKAVLALTHRQFPATCGLDDEAARADFSRGTLFAARAHATLTPGPEGALRGGVSSFGLGGTNVHVVLQEAPPRPAPIDGSEARPVMFCVGAAADDGARRARELVACVRKSGASLEELAAASRGLAGLLPARRALVIGDRDELLRSLDALGRGEGTAPVARGKVAFVFPGPGSQVAGMGRALADAEPVFRAALQRCARILEPLSVDLLALMFDPHEDAAAPIHRLALSQPAVFSFGYALACWWQDLGLRPDLVVGHSAGEYVALHLAGMLSLEDALTLVTERGRVMAAAAPGRMAAVLSSRAAVEQLLDEQRVRAPSLGIAAINAPQQTVISGSQADIDVAVAACVERGIIARLLDVDCAAHTPALERAAQDFGALAARARFGDARVPLVSTMTAELLPHLDAAHLVNHLLRPVEFVGAVRTLRALGVDAFVELGATAGLSSCVRQILDADLRDAHGADALVVACGARGEQDIGAPLRAAAALLEAGLPLQPSRLWPRSARAPVDLLGSPYQRRRLWIDAPAGGSIAPRAATLPPVSTAPRLVLAWELIRDHRTAGKSTAPASLLIDMVFDDVTPALGAVELADVVVLRPLPLDADQCRDIEITLDPARAEGRLLRSSCAEEKAPQLHLSARVCKARGRVTARLDLDAIRARLQREVKGEAVYARLDASGFVMGPTMRAVQTVSVGDGELLAQLRLPVGGNRGRRVDPALLDGASHAVVTLFPEDAASGGARGMYLGFAIDRVRFHKPVHERCLAYVRLRVAASAGASSLRYDITLLKDDGEVLAELEDFAAKRVDSSPAPVVAPRAEPRPSLDSGRSGMVDLVQSLVAERVRRAPSQIGEHAALSRLGVDSLMAVQLVKALEERLGIKLYATLLFEATTVGEVADRLLQLSPLRRAHDEGHER